jgi:hypothetical protein|tara:strand:- start:208 stop:372 length:165 start_codon:yes stop_codon:yes gene_type:complete
MLEKIKKIFKRKPKVKEVVKKEIKKEEPLVLTEEIKKPKIKETKETKSSLTFGE